MAGEPSKGIIPGLGGIAEFKYPSGQRQIMPGSDPAKAMMDAKRIQAQKDIAEAKLQAKKEKEEKKEKAERFKGVYHAHRPVLETAAAEIKQYAIDHPLDTRTPEQQAEIDRMMGELAGAVDDSKDFNSKRYNEMETVLRSGKDVTGMDEYNLLTDPEHWKKIYGEGGLTKMIVDTNTLADQFKVKEKEKHYLEGAFKIKPSQTGTKIEDDAVTITDKGANEAANKVLSEQYWQTLTKTQQDEAILFEGSKEAAIEKIANNINSRAATFHEESQDEGGGGSSRPELVFARKELIDKAQKGDDEALDVFIGGKLRGKEIIDYEYDVTGEEGRILFYVVGQDEPIAVPAKKFHHLNKIINQVPGQARISIEELSLAPEATPSELVAEFDKESLDKDIALAQKETGKEFLESLPLVESVDYNNPTFGGPPESVNIKYKTEADGFSKTETIDLTKQAGGGYDELREFILSMQKEKYTKRKGKTPAAQTNKSDTKKSDTKPSGKQYKASDGKWYSEEALRNSGYTDAHFSKMESK